jgi:hypothetical protein
MTFLLYVHFMHTVQRTKLYTKFKEGTSSSLCLAYLYCHLANLIIVVSGLCDTESEHTAN